MRTHRITHQFLLSDCNWDKSSNFLASSAANKNDIDGRYNKIRFPAITIPTFVVYIA